MTRLSTALLAQALGADARSIQVANAPKSPRKARKPSHVWRVRLRPWVIQPVGIIPVLPDETMSRAAYTARILSAPLADQLVGWWAESFTFFVPFSCMDEHEDAKQLIIDPEYDLGVSPLLAGADNAWAFAKAGTVDWVTACMKPVIRHYFRDEGQDWDDYQINGDPVAALHPPGWMDTLLAEAEAGSVPVGEEPTWEEQYEQSMTMQKAVLKAATYEEFLAQHGRAAPKPLAEPEEEYRIPELLRFSKQWQTPSTVVAAAESATHSVVSWQVQERMDKARRFGEPGFIIHVMCCRPKLYFSNQTAAAVNLLSHAHAWMPPAFDHDPHATLRWVEDDTDGPLSGHGVAGYWIDPRSIFRGGDQFMREVPAAYQAPLPAADLSRTYPTAGIQSGLFADPLKAYLDTDGILSMTIRGKVGDVHETDAS